MCTVLDRVTYCLTFREYRGYSKSMHWLSFIGVVNLLEVLGLGEGARRVVGGGEGEGEGEGEGDLDFSLEPQSSSHSLWCFLSAASILTHTTH